MSPGANRRRQRGMTLPLVVLFIMVLFAMAALAIDLGVAYTARTSAQHVADAGALAGAFTFIDGKNTQPTTAQNAAVAVAVQNKVLGQTLTPASFTTIAAPCPATNATTSVCVDTNLRRVSLYIARTGATNGVATFFSRVIGWNWVNVTTRATAEASSQAAGTHCLKPFYIANTVAANPAGTVTDACKGKEFIFDPTQDPAPLTTFGQSKLGLPFTIRPVGPQNATVPSQYASLDFGSGANTYSCVIGHCLNDPSCKVDQNILTNFTVSCGNSLTTQNGNDPNKTYQGVQDFIGDPADSWAGPGPNGGFQYCYQTGAPCPGATQDTSRSLATAPVYDNCTNPIGSGKETVKLIGFVQVFIDGIDKNTGNITAHLVSASGCGSNNGGGTDTGPSAVPIRLVQGP
jgi:Flp pilus assembly protein TadG